MERPKTGLVRLAGASVVLVRFRPGWPWEFYFVPASGAGKGLEQFARHLTAEEGARLDAVLMEHEARERLERRGYTPGGLEHRETTVLNPPAKKGSGYVF